MKIKVAKPENLHHKSISGGAKVLALAAIVGCLPLAIPTAVAAENTPASSFTLTDKQEFNTLNITGFAADVVLGSAEASELLQNKPVDTPTLDYLKDNNILIPQKGEYNTTDQTWSEGTPLKSPGSAYTITSGTEADHTFEYKTADENGNITSSYYKIERSPSLTGEYTGVDVSNLGTSKNIQWSETPFEASEYTATGSINVKVSDTETKTYYYGYTKPANYTVVTTRINDTLDSENATNKLFQGITTSSSGGAIYNTQDKSTVDIIADFINNSVTDTYNNYGGAIFNNGTIGNITGDFIGNYTSGDITYGGAIYNSASNSGTATIGNITGDFIGNYAQSPTNPAYGGAIYNDNGTIGDITGDFIGNYVDVTGSRGNAFGGAIYNVGTIGNIGNQTNFSTFSANHTITDMVPSSTTTTCAHGGAIYNVRTIGNIYANFTNNYTLGKEADGSAIYNSIGGTIGNINGDFTGNYAQGYLNVENDTTIKGHGQGAAIYNLGVIEDINSNFYNNYGIGRSANGGAIFNYKDEGRYAGSVGEIGIITGEFKGNYVQGSHAASWGGAIFNNGTIDGINGKFSNNYVTVSNFDGYGGAIFNSYQLGVGSSTGEYSYIGDIAADFIENHVESGLNAFGGAINNRETAEIKSISGEFRENYANASGSVSGDAQGGGICNQGTIQSIFDSTFNSNYVTSASGSTLGGAIYNNGTIGSVGDDGTLSGGIIADFINNSTTSSSHASGGAIANNSNGVISQIIGNFTGNSATNSKDNYAGAGAIWNSGGTIHYIEGVFSNNSSSGWGGAISTNGTIGTIKGSFNNNTAVTYGGAILNAGTINKIVDTTFTGNTAAQGGAIYNTGHIVSIENSFYKNNVISNIVGGFVYNTDSGIIDSIDADIINNTITANEDKIPALIYNNATIGTISGEVSGNTFNMDTSINSADDGAVIENMGVIDTVDLVAKNNTITGNADSPTPLIFTSKGGEIKHIRGTYTNNRNEASSNKVEGAVIGLYATSHIEDIDGVFTDNSAAAKGGGEVWGSVLALNKTGTNTVNSVNGEFRRNYTQAENGRAYGGVISVLNNQSSITSIGTADKPAIFDSNYATSNNGAVYGGVIYNNGTINSINANFENNSVNSTNKNIAGGAIHNNYSIQNIIADFTRNNATATGSDSDSCYAHGGAISNESHTDQNNKITSISGTFTENYTHSDVSNSHGGAIYSNSGSIDSIAGSFEGNYAESGSGWAYGGAIHNRNISIIKDITADFIGNYAQATTGVALGGAIYNKDGTIGSYTEDGTTVVGKINADFINNYVHSSNTKNTIETAQGGAIYNRTGVITAIEGNFTNNRAEADNGYVGGGAIYNQSSSIGSISGNFTGNYALSENGNAYGGAIFNKKFESDSMTEGIIGTIQGNFSNNYASGTELARGGAIYNFENSTIESISGEVFSGNYALSENGNAHGGAILNRGTFGSININFDGNYAQGHAEALGGAIYNRGDLGTLTNLNFTNNYAKGQTAAQGGAIYTESDLSIKADNGTSKFQGNYIQIGEGDKVYDAIYIKGADKTLTLGAYNNGKILFYDNIDGENGYNLTLNGDATGKIDLTGLVKNASTATLTTTHLTFAENTFNSDGLLFKSESGSIDLLDNEFKTYTIDKVQTNENVKWNIDIDLLNQKSDVIKTNKDSSGIIYIDAVSLDGIEIEDGVHKVQILDTTSSDLQLALNEALKGKKLLQHEHIDGLAKITNDVVWSHKFYDGHFDSYTYGELHLDKTNTLNDSIAYTITTERTEDYTLAGDTMTLWNTHVPEDNAQKNFNFTSADDIYLLTDNIGTSAGSVLNINGKTSDSNTSTINLDSHTGFVLNNGTTLNINNVKFTNSTNSEGSVINAAEGVITNLNNVNINNTNSTIKNDGTLNFVTAESKINTSISGNGVTNIGSHVKFFENSEFYNPVAITQNTINVNNGGILELFNHTKYLGQLNINAGGEVIISADSVTSEIANNGSLALYTGTLNNEVNGTGTTYILRDTVVTNNSVINQALQVMAGATLHVNANIGSNTGLITNAGTINTNADYLKGNVNNSDILNITGGIVNKLISGSGTTNIQNDSVNSGGINQAVNINSGVTLTNNAILGSDNGIITNQCTINTSATNIKGNVTNNNNLTLNGGTLAKNVSGSGTTNISGNVTNKALISQAIDILADAELTSNADNINGSVTNASKLTLNGGTLTQNVSGLGTTNISGNVTNEALISQAIDILANAELTSNASNINGSITNAGNLTLNGGTLTQDVNGLGTTNISGNVTNGALISQTINILANAELTSNADNINGSVTNASKLTLNGGTLTQNVSGSGTTNISGNVTNTGVISQNVNVSTTGHLQANNAIGNVINNGIITTNAQNLTGTIRNNNILNLSGEIGKEITGSGTTNVDNTLTILDGTNIEGTLNIVDGANILISGNTDSNYSIGLLTGNGDVEVTNGNFTINNNAELHNLTNRGNSIIEGTLIATGDISNYNKLTVNGNASAENLLNEGDMNVKGSLYIANLLNNSGDLDVFGIVKANEIINSGNINVQNSADISVEGNLTTTEDITTEGNLWVVGTLKAKNLANKGTLTVGKLIDVNNLTNNKDAEITATGDVSGNIENEGKITVSGKITSNNITNNKELTANGLVTAQNVTNNENTTLTFNNGASVDEFINNGTATIAKGLTTDRLENSSTINLSGGNININNIQNTSTINIISDANFVLNNTVEGANGTINITDSTLTTNGYIKNQSVELNNSTINLGNNQDVLKTSVLKLNNSTVNTNDGDYTNYVIDELHSNENNKFNIDILLNKDEQKADTFTLTNGGSGKIFISSINVGGNVVNNCDDNEKFRLQIIKSGSENAPQLDYDKSKVLDQASENMTNDMIFAKEFGLYTTDTLNDTLEIRGWRDPFIEWAEFVSDKDKTFTFVNDNNYVLSNDVPDIYGEKASIIGQGNTFDLNNKLFLDNIYEGQNISISDITFTNANGTTTNEGTLNLDNVNFNKDIENNNILNLKNNILLSDVTNNAELNFAGDTLSAKEITNNGNVQAIGNIKTENLVNNGKFNLEGLLNSDTLTNSDKLDVLGNIAVEKELSNSGELNVQGIVFSNKNFNNEGNAKISGDIYVNNTLTSSNNLSVDGKLQAARINNEGDLTVKNGLVTNYFSNDSSAEIFGEIKANNIINNEKLDIQGNVTSTVITNNKEASITGNLTVNKITNDGELNINKSQFDVYKITAENSGTLNITDSEINAKGTVKNQNITLTNSTLNTQDPYIFVKDSLSMNSSTMNLGKLTLKPVQLDNLNMKNSTINVISSQVDFTKGTMGSLDITGASLDKNSVINLGYLNTLNYPDKNAELIKMSFAKEDFSQNVSYKGQDTIYAPIYKYGITYDPTNGDMVFARGGRYNSATGQVDYPINPSKQFNPAILSSPVAASATATSQMSQVYAYVFQNSENFMAKPSDVRQAIIYSDRYALNENHTKQQARTHMLDESSGWFKPYVAFETVDLKHGPKVHSTIYGSLVGFDTPIESIKKGWAKSFTGYIGYNGSTQNFSGVHTVQNGGLLGATMTLYKGNFFSATTLSTGASIAETNSMFGHEDTTMLLGGAANKTGYNFEFKNGKFIIQPNVMVAYTFVNTFNYTNAAGVKIESDPMHTIQVSPGIRLMANTPKGWQPYIAINMVMNFMDKSKVTADNIVLPGISSRPYVQYGLGVQKKYKEHFMAFGQAMFQSGGRHGVSLTAGLRWCIGGDKDKHEKVQKNQNKIVKENSVKQEITNSNKTIIKQLDVSSRNRLTTQTQKQGVIKNL